VREDEGYAAVVAIAGHFGPVSGAGDLEVRDVYHMVQMPHGIGIAEPGLDVEDDGKAFQERNLREIPGT
jgi:hypothetical protein